MPLLIVRMLKLNMHFRYSKVTLLWIRWSVSSWKIREISLQCFPVQHKEFEEIEGRLKRREPLILGSTASQRFSRRLPVEVISDPLSDGESEHYEDGMDVHRQLKSHQVFAFSMSIICMTLAKFYHWPPFWIRPTFHAGQWWPVTDCWWSFST